MTDLEQLRQEQVARALVWLREEVMEPAVGSKQRPPCPHRPKVMGWPEPLGALDHILVMSIFGLDAPGLYDVVDQAHSSLPLVRLASKGGSRLVTIRPSSVSVDPRLAWKASQQDQIKLAQAEHGLLHLRALAKDSALLHSISAWLLGWAPLKVPMLNPGDFPPLLTNVDGLISAVSLIQATRNAADLDLLLRDPTLFALLPYERRHQGKEGDVRLDGGLLQGSRRARESGFGLNTLRGSNPQAYWERTILHGSAQSSLLAHAMALPTDRPPALIWRELGRKLRCYANDNDWSLPGLEKSPLWIDLCVQHRQKRWLKYPIPSSPSVKVFGMHWWPAPPQKTEQPKTEHSKIEPQETGWLSEQLQAVSMHGQGWSSLLEFARNSPWTHRPIPKADGTRRWLSVPSPQIRPLLKALHALLERAFPAQNRSCAAYLPGRGVAYHARVHAGCRAAVVVDIQDYFPSVRRRHLRPWLLPREGQEPPLLPRWSEEGRAALLELLLPQGVVGLPQGSPASPIACNLAALHMDGKIIRRAQKAFGAHNFAYSRYADDLVLSTANPDLAPNFQPIALGILNECVEAFGWKTNPEKARNFSHDRDSAFLLCGLRVPATQDGLIELGGELARRVRAAMHRLRTRPDSLEAADAHGLVSYAYSVTGDVRYLAFTSKRLARFASSVAGPLFAESLLAGWADGEPL